VRTIRDTTPEHLLHEEWLGAAPPDRAGQRGAQDAPRAAARILRLDQGLHAISIGSIAAASGTIAGMTVPAIQVSAVPSDELDPAEIVASSGEGGSWLGAEGGAVVVRSPPGGAFVLITLYGTAEQVEAPLEVDIRRLDLPQRAAIEARPAPAESEIPTEIALHIERFGDRRFPGQGWVGNRGERLRIEAFSIRPIDALLASDVEYMAFGPSGRETPWVSEGKLCGTRGRGLPLTGFAVRLAPHLRERFDAVYEGAFFSGGVAGPCRNGEPCTSAVLDDPLEAMNIRLVERVGSQ
jgi:hypothetical protein